MSQRIQTESVATQFRQDDVAMMGAVARLGFGDYRAGVQIPLSAADLTSKTLLKNLALVALIILSVAALLSLIWSRFLTSAIGHCPTLPSVLARAISMSMLPCDPG